MVECLSLKILPQFFSVWEVFVDVESALCLFLQVRLFRVLVDEPFLVSMPRVLSKEPLEVAVT